MDTFRVLLVDDERDFVDSLVKRLRRRGIDCEGVYSGEAAVGRLAAMQFDVVLLDMMLPDTDGNAVLKTIREIDPEVQVVMLTGHASVEAGQESLNLGAVDYLLKPVEMETLFQRLLSAAVRKKQMCNQGSPEGVHIFKMQHNAYDQGGKTRDESISTVL